MPKIHIFRFKPNSEPPNSMESMNQWFNSEIINSAIEPVDSYEFNDQEIMGPPGEYYSLALIVFKYVFQLKRSYNWLKGKLHGRD